MSLLAAVIASAEAGAEHGFTTHSWILPETAEIIYGGLASLLVFAALGKFALPMMKKSLADRTAKIAAELDNAKATRAAADEESARIRTALGDINSERSRLFAEADAAAAALLSEGRTRINAEAADLEAKAEADIAAAAGRVNDELKGEIARLSSLAVDRVVKSAMNDAAQQDLIEKFISNVGAAR